MNVRALRGVCVGVERHLVADDLADLDEPLAQYLASIGAVEIVPDAPAKADPEPVPDAPARTARKEK